MKQPGRRWFMFPPAEKADTSAEEQKRADDVYAIVRALTSHVAATRSEVRQMRREQQETNMKVSELAGKVDELISVANDVKSRADRGASTGVTVGAPVQEDDPQVQRLADRIDEAIKVLRGDNSTPVPPPPSPVAVGSPSDPNIDPATEVTGTRIIPEPNAPFNPQNP